MTVADLRAYLEDLPDWATVDVIGDSPDGEFAMEYDPHLSYAAGTLTITARC
jgi:hypothetical protein